MNEDWAYSRIDLGTSNSPSTSPNIPVHRFAALKTHCPKPKPHKRGKVFSRNTELQLL
ncbi:hypothetical protein N431DRAFT_137381 [Stipitochalara longipes BDJ]|nr:hypothetical protein N431DRAFT_137381 [Stipitochalara longipes BDJ]